MCVRVGFIGERVCKYESVSVNVTCVNENNCVRKQEVLTLQCCLQTDSLRHEQSHRIRIHDHQKSQAHTVPRDLQLLCRQQAQTTLHHNTHL